MTEQAKYKAADHKDGQGERCAFRFGDGSVCGLLQFANPHGPRYTHSFTPTAPPAPEPANAEARCPSTYQFPEGVEQCALTPGHEGEHESEQSVWAAKPAPGPDERSETGALNTAKGGEGLERIRKALEQDRIGHAAFHDTQPDSFCCSPMANGIASELLRLIEVLTRGAKEWNYNDPGGANE
jgi:hypothetical protein